MKRSSFNLKSGYGTIFRLVAFASLISALVSSVIGTEPSDLPYFRFSPSDGTSYDHFGASCAMSGDYLIVGAHYAPYSDSSPSASTGTAYIFSQSTGEQIERITSGTPISNSKFGCSVAISGETAVVGAPSSTFSEDGQSHFEAGTAFVYTHTPGTTLWPRFVSLTQPSPWMDNNFGYAVAIEDNTIVVGAPSSFILTGYGSVHVFRYTLGMWLYEAELTKLSAVRFGESVDISNKTIVVGAPLTMDLDDNHVGQAFVYTRSGTSWSHQATLHGDEWYHDHFGASVAISGDTIIIGAPDHGKDMPDDGAGSAYVFEREGSTWSRTNDLRPDSVTRHDMFGYRVAIENTTAVVATPNADGPSEMSDAGKVYTFSKSGSSWAVVAELVDPNGQTGDKLGSSVCIHEGIVVAGSEYADVHGDNSGAATIFEAGFPIPPGSNISPGLLLGIFTGIGLILYSVLFIIFCGPIVVPVIFIIIPAVVACIVVIPILGLTFLASIFWLAEADLASDQKEALYYVCIAAHFVVGAILIVFGVVFIDIVSLCLVALCFVILILGLAVVVVGLASAIICVIICAILCVLVFLPPVVCAIVLVAMVVICVVSDVIFAIVAAIICVLVILSHVVFAIFVGVIVLALCAVAAAACVVSGVGIGVSHVVFFLILGLVVILVSLVAAILCVLIFMAHVVFAIFVGVIVLGVFAIIPFSFVLTFAASTVVLVVATFIITPIAICIAVIALILAAVYDAVTFNLRIVARYNKYRAQLRDAREKHAFLAIEDEPYAQATKFNGRMMVHPHLAEEVLEKDDSSLVSAAKYLANAYKHRFAAVNFEKALNLTPDGLNTLAKHCEDLVAKHPMFAAKINAAHVQAVGRSAFRRDVFAVTSSAATPHDVDVLVKYAETDASQWKAHPLAAPFIVSSTCPIAKLDTARRAWALLDGVDQISFQKAWNSIEQAIENQTDLVKRKFKRMNLARIIETLDVAGKCAAVDVNDLVPKAAETWATDVERLLSAEQKWSLDQPGRERFSAHVAALQARIGNVQLFADHDILDGEVVEKLRITATAAVRDEALLRSIPIDHGVEMGRIKNDIVLAKRKMFNAENPAVGEENENPVVARARLRQLGREREQLLAGLAHLNEVGFTDAPVLPPLENRCEDMMTLAMFEDMHPLAQSNAIISSARYSGEAVVLKQYSASDERARRRIFKELRTLEAIHHPNIVQIKYAFPDQGLFYLVFDHYKYGDLLDWANDTNPTEGDVLYAAKKTIEAVACLHDHNIIHCDIKPANVFVTATGNPMLGDFDVSKSTDGLTLTATAVGTLPYMAPELYTTSDTGEQPRMSAVTDVFSLGRTLSQLVAGRTDLLDGVIKRMTAKEPADRPTLVEVLQEAAFTDAERGRVAGIAQQLAELKKREETLGREERTLLAQVKQVTDVMWARHEELAAEARRIEHLKEERLCMICKERLAVHAYSKCGHVSVCAVCDQPKRCPRCHKKSTKVCYAFKGALSKVTASSFAMIGTAERAEVVRAFVLDYGMFDTVMTLKDLLHNHPHLPFHKMDDELMLETLRHMKARGMAVLIPCNDGMGVKFPYPVL